MLRLAFLLLALVANHHWFWNVGILPDGEWHVWAGTMHRFGEGPHAYLEWDDEGLAWSILWVDWDDPQSEYERDAWGFEGRMYRAGR